MGVKINSSVGVNISKALQKREGFSVDHAQNCTFTLLLNPVFCNICTMCWKKAGWSGSQWKNTRMKLKKNENKSEIN